MGLRRFTPYALFLPLIVGVGCGINTSTGNSPHGAGGQSSGSAGATASGGSGVGAAGASTSPLLPAGIRRLSNAEYEASAKAVVGNSDPVTTDFAPDTRQGGYTLNDAQRVDSVLVKQIAGAATKLAAEVRAQVDTFAPCTDKVGQLDACAKTFIQSFATKAFRRPISADESAKLLELFHVGSDGAAYADGVEQVATGVLQSAGFLYLTEVGDGSASSPITLTPYETASSISYLVTGGPPDAALLDAAAQGQLATPEQRSAHFARLFASGNATAGASRARVVRIVKEWLGTDRLVDTAKDSTVYGSYAGLKTAMTNETGDFVQHLLDTKTGTVGELLGAPWTATKDQGLTQLYNGSSSGTDGEITLPDRRGILNQAAFLSVYAHASETGPVLRGVAVERRIACMVVPSPAQLMLTVPPLAPDPTKTMRQRLGDHVVNAACSVCHAKIDAFGFSFEQYDGMGQRQTQDHNQPIDSATSVKVGLDFDGDYADSNALAAVFAKSDTVRECFTRLMYRAAAATGDDAATPGEAEFVQFWHALPVAAQGNIVETLIAYVKSPNFGRRQAL